MKEYVILTDSCAELGQDMIDSLGILAEPLQFTLNGKGYANWPDGREISFADFYRKLREGGTSSTSQVNTAEFVEVFRKVAEEGRDILYIGFSSGLSGTVNSAFIAAEEVMRTHPGSRILVTDSLAASLGQGLMVWHAVQKKNGGMPIEQLAAWVDANKLRFCHWFTVDDLQFLRRGGRLSGTVALLGTMLGIKPVLHVDNEGHLVNVEKARGRKRSLDALVDHMEKTVDINENPIVFISHGDCIRDARYVADEVRRRFGIQDVYINYIGPVIGSHAGPGTVALFFIGRER